MKLEHSAHYIQVLEGEIKESNKLAMREKKECEDQVHKLVEDLERFKIENRELKSLKEGRKKTKLKKHSW